MRTKRLVFVSCRKVIIFPEGLTLPGSKFYGMGKYTDLGNCNDAVSEMVMIRLYIVMYISLSIKDTSNLCSAPLTLNGSQYTKLCFQVEAICEPTQHTTHMTVHSHQPECKDSQGNTDILFYKTVIFILHFY